jgi:PAS domain S-box-containing protein
LETTTGATSAWGRLRSALPEGRELPEGEFRTRHRAILLILWAHAVGLAAFGLYRGVSLELVVGECLVLAGLAAIAAWRRLGRRFRSGVSALGLVTSSAILVQFSGGYIEAHFHYFVVVAVVAMYQDWVPFLLAVLYVAVDHGLVGTLAPSWVYNHPDAVGNPWKWAGIHAVLVLAECAALVTVWRYSEQARLRADLLLRSTGEGLVGTGLDGRITFANPAAAALVGRAERQLVGTPWTELFPRWTMPEQAMGRAAETELVRADGRRLPVEVVATAVLQHGERRGAVVAFRDVTERKEAEREHLARLEKDREIHRLQEEAAFKTLFINTAAHELRTPLTPLKLHLHVLRGEKRGGLNEEQRRITAILGRNLDRLGHLVEDVLDVGRLQSGRIRLEVDEVHLDRLLNEVREAFQELAARNGVAMDCQAAPGLVARADGKRVTQILFNLVDNALKFTPKGGRLALTLRPDGPGMAAIEVRDSGVGLSKDDMGKLFHPFSQAHDPMEQTRSGSGLGLYISRGLAELHGGTLEAASDGRGKGATFTLRLPLAEPAPALAVTSAAPARLPG